MLTREDDVDAHVNGQFWVPTGGHVEVPTSRELFSWW